VTKTGRAAAPPGQSLAIYILLPSLIEGRSIFARPTDNILPVSVRLDKVFDIMLETALCVMWTLNTFCLLEDLEFLSV
jgi:hypothetical protein